jgi:hypothetical protein
VRKLCSALLVAGMVAAGCGGDDSVEAEGGVKIANADVRYSEEQAAKMIGLERDDSGIAWVHPESDCDVAVVMTDPDSVAMYRDAGDTVVSTADDSVGVKIVDDDPSCPDALAAAMKNVK